MPVINVEEKLFNIILQNYKNHVYKVICKIIKNSNDAEDVTQEVFTRLWSEMKIGEIESYLFRLATELSRESIAHRLQSPVQIVETASIYKAVRRRLLEDVGREPLDAEIAAEMGIDIEKVGYIKEAIQLTVSFESRKPIAQGVTSSPSQSAARRLLKEQVIQIISDFSPREQKILEMRFGLEDGITQTLEEVGVMFGVTRERIRQIEAEAIEKMRKHHLVKKLEEY